jgi:hypothetical protein
MDEINRWPKAHIAGETLLAQPAREAADTKDHNETDHTLSEFWKSTAVLRNVLDQGRSLSNPELRLLENHFHVLQMTYLLWKRC